MDEEAINPTKQHSMKCPKLFGKECKCDGYHTFEELYEHRMTLFIALCRKFQSVGGKGDVRVWRSELHSDGTSYKGWFILGLGKEKGEQITYHLPASKWQDTGFAETLEKAPDFDGHAAEDVLERISNL